MSTKSETLLIIDDDGDTRALLSHILRRGGYQTDTAGNAAEAMKILEATTPSAILLDLLMPGMNGLEFCRTLQANREFSRIPVLMITSRSGDDTRRDALNAGVADFIHKGELNRKSLLEKVSGVLESASRWNKLDRPSEGPGLQDISGFADFLTEAADISPEASAPLHAASPREIYDAAAAAGVDPVETARQIAMFLRLPAYPYLDPETVLTDMLPSAFSRAHRVLAVREGDAGVRFVAANPFEPQLVDMLESLMGKKPLLGVTCPDCIDALLRRDEQESEGVMSDIDAGEEAGDITPEVTEFSGAIEISEKPTEEDIRKFPIRYIADSILFSAASEGASDIHVEPKPEKVLVRFRIDGDMRDMYTLKKKTGSILISRFKVLGDMDIAERRKPQDGIAEAKIAGKSFKLRFATTSTPQGESLIVRLLDLYAKPRK
ncbi:MAG TPA: ATPase, T2SS/T4P/T4SS family, partial [Candidatus Sabulitectum sp.]|nr:ATPase, T2SS/T4P/T4SS family [Candidatus Sabulitectum sp.]